MSYLYIGIGANLTPAGYKTPREGCEAALASLQVEGICLKQISNWYETAPVPVSDQPWYLNAVAFATTSVDPSMALAALHRIESCFGRVRKEQNEARVLDMDLLDFDGECKQNSSLTLPHPRMHERAFVLLPLRELCPEWTHPISGISIDNLVERLPPGQKIRLAV